MDIVVHRSRFIEWSPTAITCLALPPLPPPPRSSPTNAGVRNQPPPRWFGTLAVGRANGNIELREWSGTPANEFSPQAWVLRKILPAPLKSKVETLVFSLRNPRRHSLHNPPALMDLRLFSSGGGTDVVEWDVASGTILRTYPIHGGSIWSLAVNPSSTLLACGCDDGTIRLLSIAKNALEHYRIMGPSRGKVLSIAWGPPSRRAPTQAKPPRKDAASDDERTEESSVEGDDNGDEWTDEWLASGGSDASVKRWRVKDGSVIATMRTDQVRSSRTLVWAVGVLLDGTIISGDSMGLIKFWDIRTCTQIKSIQAHEADVLCLAIGPDGTSVFSSGVDQCVTECILTTVDSQSSYMEWTKTRSKRIHSHDVRGLVVWPPFSPFPQQRVNPGIAPLLVSGGQDMVLVISPCATPNSARKLSNPIAVNARASLTRGSTLSDGMSQKASYPLSGVICVAKGARLVVCRKATGVVVWKIKERDAVNGFDRVLDMDLNVTTHLIATAISHDGRWLAVSDAVELKLFRLADDIGASKPVRIKTVSAVLLKELQPSSSSSLPSAAASNLLFTPDSTRLVVVCSPSSEIVIIDLGASTGQDISPLRSFPHHGKPTGDDRVLKGLPGGAVGSTLAEAQSNAMVPMVTAMDVSSDGQWLATADDRGRCHVFNLDTLQHHCTLPSFELPIRDLLFDPSSPHTIVLAQVNNRLFVFDVEGRTFPKWAKNVCDHLPETFTGLKPGIEGLIYVPDEQEKKHQLLAWGTNWLCKIRLDGPRRTNKFGSSSKRQWQTTGKRGEGEGKVDTFTPVTTYRHMICVAPIGERNEIVVVERPMLDLLTADGQPPPFHKHHFGT